MTSDLSLPEFNVPDLKPGKLGADTFHAWLIQNLEILESSGKLEAIRERGNRRPVSARFVMEAGT